MAKFIRIEFPITISELRDIDKAAKRGITKPAIASGIVMELYTKDKNKFSFIILYVFLEIKNA